MKIVLNGEERELAAPTTVAQLLRQIGLAEKRVAVEVNLEIVPRSEHSRHALSDRDRVEIVQAIGGG
ncbi:MAG: sulfur carrier protein ThiS [Acidiferrobacteraceae bacterium]|jgi:sulfur carrier protein